jgi:hypothetical protein
MPPVLELLARVRWVNVGALLACGLATAMIVIAPGGPARSAHGLGAASGSAPSTDPAVSPPAPSAAPRRPAGPGPAGVRVEPPAGSSGRRAASPRADRSARVRAGGYVPSAAPGATGGGGMPAPPPKSTPAIRGDMRSRTGAPGPRRVGPRRRPPRLGQGPYPATPARGRYQPGPPVEARAKRWRVRRSRGPAGKSGRGGSDRRRGDSRAVRGRGPARPGAERRQGAAAPSTRTPTPARRRPRPQRSAPPNASPPAAPSAARPPGRGEFDVG